MVIFPLCSHSGYSVAINHTLHINFPNQLSGKLTGFLLLCSIFNVYMLSIIKEKRNEAYVQSLWFKLRSPTTPRFRNLSVISNGSWWRKSRYLKIQVHDVLVMHVLQSLEQLIHVKGSFFLSQTVRSCHTLEQLTTRNTERTKERNFQRWMEERSKEI